eukprot:m.453537 g.453537  ORF g.453537 m.453537 type:complete len:130 (-) comp20517_c0_seq1:161-550(-)
MGQMHSSKRSKAAAPRVPSPILEPKQLAMMTPDHRDRMTRSEPKRKDFDNYIENFQAPTFLDFNLLDDSGRLTPEDWSGVTGLDDSMEWFGVTHPEQEAAVPIRPKALLSESDLQQCEIERIQRDHSLA